MGGSAAEVPAEAGEQPASGLRASDAERDQVVERLREEFVAGRLSHETFLYRVGAVLESRRQGDLPPVLADLPAPRTLAERMRGALARLAPARGALTSRARAAEPPVPARSARRRPALTTRMGSLPDHAQPVALRFPRGEGSRFSIGRDARCDLAIADLSVSRLHAELERTPDGWLLIDLESTNGTRVNGWRARGKTPVAPGDLVSFGDLEAVFLS